MFCLLCTKALINLWPEMFAVRFFGITLFILFALACKHNQPSMSGGISRDIPVDSIAVPNHNDSTDSALRAQDRTIWQKPYMLIDMLGDLSDKIVADIGAGSGYFSFRFVHRAKKVIAIDIEPTLIEMMNTEETYYKPEVQLRFEARLATPDDPHLKDGEVDIIFISNTYPYIKNRRNYLHRLLKKFRSQGKIMIVDFKKKLSPIGPPQEERLSLADVEQDLIDAGYKLMVSDDTSLDYQYIIIASPL